MDDIKEGARDVRDGRQAGMAQGRRRRSLGDKVANAGDEMREQLGNAGDEIRDIADD